MISKIIVDIAAAIHNNNHAVYDEKHLQQYRGINIRSFWMLALAALLMQGLTTGCSLNTDINPVQTNDKSEMMSRKSKSGIEQSVDETESFGSVLYDGETVTLSAISTGCTSSGDFQVEHRIQNGVCYALVVRKKPDYCRRSRTMQNLSLVWKPPEACNNMEVVFDNMIIEIPAKSQISKKIELLQ